MTFVPIDPQFLVKLPLGSCKKTSVRIICYTYIELLGDFIVPMSCLSSWLLV